MSSYLRKALLPLTCLYLTGNVTATAPNAPTTEAILVPINRYPHGKGGKVTILEVLKCFYELSTFDNYSSNNGTLGFITAGLSTAQPTGPLSFANPRTLDFVTREFKTAGALPIVSNLFHATEEDPVVHDLTDGAGHGMLVATDQLFLTINSSNMIAPAGVTCRILYRYKSVSLTEYIGIVQSQQ